MTKEAPEQIYALSAKICIGFVGEALVTTFQVYPSPDIDMVIVSPDPVVVTDPAPNILSVFEEGVADPILATNRVGTSGGRTPPPFSSAPAWLITTP